MARGRKTDLHHAINDYNEDIEWRRESLRDDILMERATVGDVMNYLSIEKNRDAHIRERVRQIREERALIKSIKNNLNE